MNEQNQLAVQEPSVATMMQTFIERGVTAENVAAMKELVGLQERMNAKQAEREFAAAFVQLQSEMPKVTATKPVPGKDGSIRYHYAPFEEIMKQVQPLLTRHGFTVTFDTRFIDGGRCVSVCTLMHTGGHSRSNEFAARVGHGPPHASEAQADGAAQTYSKRFALCNALNIVVSGMDDDARAEGGFITKEQADDLRRRVKETDSDERRFLSYAQAESYEEIRDSRFAALDGFLAKKEKPKQPQGERDADGNFTF